MSDRSRGMTRREALGWMAGAAAFGATSLLLPAGT
jgi:hypothetical protein